MPRVLMHEMPEDWQDRMAALCEEWENIASRDPVFAALDSVVPGWREHGSDTASAAATVITELSARATSNGSRPFRWDDDEGEAPSAWGPK
jgi:hypothetical protein